MNISAFRAYRIHDDGTGHRAGFESMQTSDLSPGEVLVKVAYSSVNYKDALAATGKGKILRRPALNGGIDSAGGALLAQLLACTTPNDNVASISLVADSRFTATVMPFILRGVSLLGIGSVVVPVDVRDEVRRR